MFRSAYRPTLSDYVTSVMYASAINVIMAKSLGLEPVHFLLSLFIITFLTVDWLSRVTLPFTFPSADQENRRTLGTQLMKGLAEILCVYLVVVGGLSLMRPADFPPGTFGWWYTLPFFFLASFAWNLVALRIMPTLSWRRLFLACLSGTVFDLPEASEYTKRFKDDIERATYLLQNQGSTSDKILANEKFHRTLRISAVSRVIAQSVASHITWANLFVGILLLLSGRQSFMTDE
jgi:hypothetical protein